MFDYRSCIIVSVISNGNRVALYQCPSKFNGCMSIFVQRGHPIEQDGSARWGL